MKTWILLLTLILIPFLAKNYPETPVRPLGGYCDIPVQDQTWHPKPRIKFIPSSLKAILGKLESGNNYNIVNRYGMLGKYQFSPRTLQGLVSTGYLDSIPDNFLDNPEAQENAMNALIRHNRDILKRYGTYNYIGKVVNGVTITEARLLAGAHLIGPYATHDFVKTGSLEPAITRSGKMIPKIDGNGTSVLDYMRAV